MGTFMRKRILVTGGAGFVGANLINALVKRGGYEIHNITRVGGSLWRLDDDVLKDIKIHKDYLSNKKKLSELLKRIQPSIIYHLATYGSYPTQPDITKMIEVNILGTQNLLEALKDINFMHLIVVGSSSEYGKKEKPMSESDVLEPNNFYAATKAAQTYLASVFSKTYKKPITICRLFNVYGPLEEKGRLVRSVIESALRSDPILLATGKEVRDLIFIDDVVDALIHVSQKKLEEGEIFNIGTGIQTSILNLAKMVVQLAKSKSQIKLNAYAGRSWDTAHWKADTKKTKSILKWAAEYDLKDGLKRTIDWYRHATK